jgi:hypothetical protein
MRISLTKSTIFLKDPFGRESMVLFAIENPVWLADIGAGFSSRFSRLPARKVNSNSDVQETRDWCGHYHFSPRNLYNIPGGEGWMG